MKTCNALLLSLLLVISTSMICLTARAEDSAAESQQTETTETLLATSETLLAEVNELSRQASTLKNKYAKIPEVDHPLFFHLVFSVEKKLREKLDQLIEVQQTLEKRKVDVEPLRRQLQAISAEQSTIIEKELKFLANILIQLREQDKGDGSQELTIYRTDQEVNRLIAAWQQNVVREKKLNMDVTDDVETLRQIVQLRAISQTGRIQLILDNINLLNTHIDSESIEEQEVIGKQLRQLEIRKNQSAVNLEEMVGIMNELGMETTAFGQVLVVATGEILNENVDTEVMLGLFQMVVNKARIWFRVNLPRIIFKIISFILIILFFKLIAGILRRLVDRAATSSHLKSSQLLQHFLGSITSKVVMLIGLIIALSQLGIEIGPLLAGMGVMGFVVGFALQDALSNFASGMMILLYRPFDIGDLVEVAGITGEVKQMSLVSTTILTLDRKRMIIPNSKIWGDIITNVTAETFRRIDLVFGIGYSDNIARAESVLQNILEQHELVLSKPKPVVKVHTLNESSVDFVVRPWVKTQNYWEVYWDITRQVKEKFDEEGISIPFPQRDIHMIPAGQE